MGMLIHRRYREVEGEAAQAAPTAEPVAFAYGRSDINRMSTADLQKLAEEDGMEGAGEKSGADLKKYFLEKYSL